jgi:hypothetical protein
MRRGHELGVSDQLPWDSAVDSGRRYEKSVIHILSLYIHSFPLDQRLVYNSLFVLALVEQAGYH